MHAMRQLLHRKSNQRMFDENSSSSRSETFQSAGDPSHERVFPLRNVHSRGEGHTSAPSMKPEAPRVSGKDSEHPSLSFSPRAQSSQNRSLGSKDSDEKRKVSQRSQYVPLKSESPFVLPGVGADKGRGSPVYRRCEDEPIHTPGAIQSFGALLGLNYTDNGNLEVRIASENTRKVLGYGPEQLFKLPSFLDILGKDVRQEMVAHVKNALDNGSAIQEETRLDVFQMIISFPYEPDLHLWCAIHPAPTQQGLIICEFEAYSDAFYLKDVGVTKAPPVRPIGMMDFDVSPEEFKKSTTSASKPLPVIEMAHQKQNKHFSSLDLFNAMSQAQQQISAATTLQTLLEVVVGIISELTGFHRVMFYRFDSQKNGCVDAELVNPQACTDIFRGMHYPASDIPPQARRLYIINRIRILHDRGAETARLVCRDEKDFATPLDLTHAYLRAMSPVHNKYLANMGVRSTMSISIIINSDLWGLIACHGYGDVGIQVSLPVRELCRSIGECAAVHIHRLILQKSLDARRPSPIMNSLSPNPAGLLATSSTHLLELLDADFAVLNIDNDTRTIGRLEPYREGIAIVSYLQSCQFSKVRCSHNITADFPGLSYPPGLKTICGLLLVPLSIGNGNDFLVFFRKGQKKQVKWAGNPYEKTFKGASEYLDPRNSFKRWVETIEGTSREWSEDQLDTASLLGMLYSQYGRFKLAETPDDHLQAVDETFHLNNTVSKLKEALQKEARRKGLDLIMSVSDELPDLVKGEADRLRQSIIYFTSNAFKDSTSVKVDIDLIGMKDDASIIGITFQDNGPGLTEEELDDVFQEFEEAQDGENWPFPSKEPATNLTDTNGGTTIDLSVVARYVRASNGQIRVQSEVGKGTIFSMELPFQHAQIPGISKSKKLRNIFLPSSVGSPKSPLQSTAPFMKSPRPNSTEQRKSLIHIPDEGSFAPRVHVEQLEEDNGSRSGAYAHDFDRYDMDANEIEGSKSSVPLNVLVAGENSISLGMLNKKLSSKGHTVEVASSGQEAHDFFSSNMSKFDVILMDSEMPSVDGMLSTRIIRFLEKESKHNPKSDSRHSPNSIGSSQQRVPIIVVSASLHEENRFDYIQNGFDGWIMKPIDFRRLDVVLQGVKSPELRRDLLYVPGKWERGGWFLL